MQKKSKKNHTTSDGTYRFGAFDLYPAERELHRSQEPVALQPKVFDALLLFVQNAGHLVRRDALLDRLWPDTHVTDTNLTNIIVSLRKVLGREAIQTVSKFGYRFTLPVLGEPGIEQGIYATFLRAKELVTHRSLESMGQARDLLSLCVAEDPQFAAAWAWLGRSCRFLDKFKAGPSIDLDLAQAALRRALAIDPNLACAHQFYTQLQMDLGESRAAAVRLTERLHRRGDDPETLAGLVQALRFCGLLDDSVAAHVRATALDPTIVTSVPHTHFLRCEYEATLDTLGAATRYYLDAAAWTGLGDMRRAVEVLRERLGQKLSTQMSGLMSSLLAVLEGRRDEALTAMRRLQVEREPEIRFYLSRHYAMLGASSDAIEMLRRARDEGFTSSRTLVQDEVFARMRKQEVFRQELERARANERAAKRDVDRAERGGPASAKVSGMR